MFGFFIYKVKENSVRALLNLPINLQCSFTPIVLLFFRLSSDYNFLYISSPAVSKKPRDCLREWVETIKRVQSIEVELREPFTYRRKKSYFFFTVIFILYTQMFSRVIERCYNSKTLEWVNMKNLILGLTQENLIENSVQNCLHFMLNYNGLCYYFSSLPERPCVCLKANMCKTYCIIVHWDTNIFLFLFIDDKEACDCGYMTYHMIWGHRPRAD